MKIRESLLRMYKYILSEEFFVMEKVGGRQGGGERGRYTNDKSKTHDLDPNLIDPPVYITFLRFYYFPLIFFFFFF